MKYAMISENERVSPVSICNNCFCSSRFFRLGRAFCHYFVFLKQSVRLSSLRSLNYNTVIHSVTHIYADKSSQMCNFILSHKHYVPSESGANG